MYNKKYSTLPDIILKTPTLSKSPCPPNLHATNPTVGENRNDFSAAANSMAWRSSCFSSALAKSFCLIIVILAIVAMAAREAFRMNTILKPFEYPFSMMSLAVDDRIPRVEGEVNEYGSLMMVFIKAEGRASLCMVALNELLLRRQYERREGNG